jgi:glycosyltransferase involved in cell wall biosynthesis
MFSELGIDVFSHGAYHNPQKLDDKKRPALDIPFHKEFSDNTLLYPKENLEPALIEWADVIVVMHVYDWIIRNLEKLKGKRVIWRSIGQCVHTDESHLRRLKMEGVELVRYSPREKTIPGFAGEDALIRFGKDPKEYGPWRGDKEHVITVAQSMRQRDQSCNWRIFDKATKNFPRKVFGPHNEDLGPVFGGCPDYTTLLDELRGARIYFYTGTYPASYTLNFVEAAMTGTPMVSLGPLLGNSPDLLGQQTYEVAELLQRYGAGLSADRIDTLEWSVGELWHDDKNRQKLSKNIREMALDLFDKEKIKEQWKKLLFS